MISINSLFKRIQRNWEEYTERDLAYFLPAYFLLLFARFAAEYQRMIMEVRYNPEFQVIFWPVTSRPPVLLHQFVLTATLAIIPLCLVRKLRPLLLLALFPALFWLVTVHESLYSPMLSGRHFHVRLAVLYPMFVILVWDWIRILKSRAGRPAEKIDSAVPIVLTQWIVGIVYLGPAMHRLLNSGYPGWFDGVTLQTILLERWIAFGGDNALFMAQNYWLCLIAQQMVLLFEVGFIFSVFFPAIAPLAVAAGLIFHLSSEWAMSVTYLDFMVILYSAYFHPHFFRTARRALKFGRFSKNVV